MGAHWLIEPFETEANLVKKQIKKPAFTTKHSFRYFKAREQLELSYISTMNMQIAPEGH